MEKLLYFKYFCFLERLWQVWIARKKRPGDEVELVGHVQAAMMIWVSFSPFFLDSLLVKLSHILGVDSFAANAFSLWNFSYCFSALKQWQIPKGKYDFHVRMLHINLKILSVFTFLYIS